jgi:hypothetical protein
MSYSNSSEMGGHVYTRNYGLPLANKQQQDRNLEYLRNALPRSEHHNIHLYIDPGGNVSRNMLGQLQPDINKILDNCKK